MVTFLLVWVYLCLFSQGLAAMYAMLIHTQSLVMQLFSTGVLLHRYNIMPNSNSQHQGSICIFISLAVWQHLSRTWLSLASGYP